MTIHLKKLEAKILRASTYSEKLSENHEHFQKYNSSSNRKKTKEIPIDLKNIPFPNELELEPEEISQKSTYRKYDNNNFLDNIFSLDGLIIIGMIFLLIEEGIVDEVLLIILVYLLLDNIIL